MNFSPKGRSGMKALGLSFTGSGISPSRPVPAQAARARTTMKTAPKTQIMRQSLLFGFGQEIP